MFAWQSKLEKYERGIYDNPKKYSHKNFQMNSNMICSEDTNITYYTI